MKTHRHNLRRSISALLLAAASQLTAANDNATASDNSLPDPNSENGGFLELALGVGHVDFARVDEIEGLRSNPGDKLFLNIHGAYRYKRFFVEATRDGFDGLNLGATLWQNDKWSVDFLAANIGGNKNGDDDSAAVSEAEKNIALIDRDTFFAGAGARITRYFGNDKIAQFRLLSDYYESNGALWSARLGKQWQHGNWSYTGFLGARYNTAKLNNYLYAVSASEATQLFPEYKAGNTVSLEAEIGVSYPLSRKLVFRSDLSLVRYQREIYNSPLLDDKQDAKFTAGISYVF
ncbi:MAG: MipA/OmpV family protein [Granulosicoccaceae bacterium]